MDWKHLLASITGTVDQELLLRNEYLETENRILRNQITGRVRLTDDERKALAEIGQKLGKQALQDVAKIVKPDTILGWHRQLVAQKCDGSQQRQAPGRPTIDPELEALVVRLAQDANPLVDPRDRKPDNKPGKKPRVAIIPSGNRVMVISDDPGWVWRSGHRPGG